MASPAEVLSVDGTRLEIAWHGAAGTTGPVIVLLHEGLGCVAAWREFPAELARATGLRVFVYSRAAYGRSDPVRLPRPRSYMHDEASGPLPRLLAVAGIDDAILYGHSDGASIAVVFTGSSPAARVRGLVLEAPHVFCEPLSVESLAAAREAFLHGGLRARLARTQGDNVDVAFWGWNDAWLDPAFRAWNLEEFLPRIRVPSLVLQSERDPYGTLAQVEAIERGSGGPVRRALLGSGHAPYKEDPPAVLAAVVDFVRSLEP